LLALLLNGDGTRGDALLVAAILLLWALRSLRQSLWTSEPNLGRTVGSLLAGIVFVDWLAVANAPRPVGLLFLALFGTALLGQRFVPPT
jgi:hypothetical protein